MCGVAKGKVQEFVEQVLAVAAIAELVKRMVSAAAGWLYPEAWVQEQLLFQLRMLVIVLHSTVEEAERVHIRRRWLREWLSELRDAALDGDKVLRSYRQRRRRLSREEQQQQQASGGNTTVKRIVIWLFRPVDSDASRLRRTVALLEKVYTSNIGDFLTLLERSTRASSPQAAAEDEHDNGGNQDADDGDNEDEGSSDSDDGDNEDEDSSDSDDSDGRPALGLVQGAVDVVCARVDPRHRVPKSMGSSKHIASKQAQGFVKSRMRSKSVAEPPVWRAVIRGIDDFQGLGFTAALICSMIRIGLMMVMQNIRQAIDKLRTPLDWRSLAPEEPDTRRMHLLVIRIRGALETSDRAEVYGSRWLAKWRRELQAVADRADRLLLAVSAPAPPAAEAESATHLLRQASLREELRRAAHSVETAVAHLDDFVALVRFTVIV